MNYWQAKRCYDVAVEFEKLTKEYWSILPQQHASVLVKFKYDDNEESAVIRMKIAHLLPLVEKAADSLGVSYIAQSYPAPAVGGPVLPVNIFHSVIEPEIGHSILDRQLITDTIVRVKVVAQQEIKEQFIHMLLPWNWVIDLCALIIRFPFIILERAGLPREIENNIVSQAIKIVGTIILVSFLIYKGVSLSGASLAELLKIFVK